MWTEVVSLRPSSARRTGFETNGAALLVALTDVASTAKAAVVESICSVRWEFGCPSGLLRLVVLGGGWACRLHTSQPCVQESGYLQTCEFTDHRVQ